MRKSIIPTSANKDQVMIQSLLRNALTVSENGKRVVAHIPVCLMKMDYTYQREIKHNGLINKWDPDKSQIITLSYRKGEPDAFYIIDGQHRVDAARKNGTPNLVAEVFTGLTLEDEAKMFATQNDGTARLSTYDTYKANLVHGQVIDTTIENVCRKYGVIVSKLRKPKHLTGLGEARVCVKMHGDKCFDWILSVVDRSDWDVHKQSYTASWLRAFRFAYTENIANLDRAKDNLAKTLRNCNPTMISVFASVSYPSMEIRKGISVALDKIAKGNVGIDDIENAIKSHL